MKMNETEINALVEAIIAAKSVSVVKNEDGTRTILLESSEDDASSVR
jgi:hypothetical protein